MELLIVWFVSVVIGCIVGAQKDRPGSGFVWPFLFGPLGTIVVLCLPNLKAQKEQAERDRLAKAQYDLLKQQAGIHSATQRRIPPPPSATPMLRVASSGQDLGEMPLATVATMLRTGKLSPSDHYWDADAGDWMPLDCCAELV